MDYNLIIPAFVAGLITFFAPCTFPLVPAYIGFISGISIQNHGKLILSGRDRLSILINGSLFVIGFSTIFILLGTAFGWGGVIFATHRIWLSRIGGIIVILFGLNMLKVLNFSYLKIMSSERRLNLTKYLKPGNPLSSLLFGATFAFGWSPCVGPLLGTILLLATTSKTVVAGGFLLFVFSLGLAVPFLLLAAGLDYGLKYIPKIKRVLAFVSILGGIMLVVIGLFLLFDRFNLWILYFYKSFNFINYRGLLYYL